MDSLVGVLEFVLRDTPSNMVTSWSLLSIDFCFVLYPFSCWLRRIRKPATQITRRMIDNEFARYYRRSTFHTTTSSRDTTGAHHFMERRLVTSMVIFSYFNGTFPFHSTCSNKPLWKRSRYSTRIMQSSFCDFWLWLLYNQLVCHSLWFAIFNSAVICIGC